jgi:hypothetical protein
VSPTIESGGWPRENPALGSTRVKSPRILLPNLTAHKSAAWILIHTLDRFRSAERKTGKLVHSLENRKSCR